jgi:hypothetical protein
VASVAAKKRPGFRLLAVVIASLFAFACFEVVLRIVDVGGYAVLEDKERFTTEILDRDERGWLRLEANATSHYLGHEVRISAQRLRNREVVVPKPAGVYRVLVVGDSVPFGWGVGEGESFPRLLEAALQQSPRRDGKTWEVVNGGSPGWGLVEQFTWLETNGVAFEPDFVLHSIINNDIDPQPKAPPLFLTDGLRKVRTLRLLETILGRVAGDPGVEPGTGLSPELVVMAIDRFRLLCAEKGCGYAVIDAYERVQEAGKPEQRFPLAAVEHMAKVGVPLLDLGLTREWVHAHQVAKNDYHPDAAGHAEIAAKLLPMVKALAEK